MPLAGNILVGFRSRCYRWPRHFVLLLTRTVLWEARQHRDGYRMQRARNTIVRTRANPALSQCGRVVTGTGTCLHCGRNPVYPRSYGREGARSHAGGDGLRLLVPDHRNCVASALANRVALWTHSGSRSAGLHEESQRVGIKSRPPTLIAPHRV